jgi:deoxyribodipyrimidine photo-lyase
MPSNALIWFRNDLRLNDNPALVDAAAAGSNLSFAFVLDETGRHGRVLGSAQKWWLHHSLEALSQSITRRGGKLHLFRGDPAELIPQIAKELEVDSVYWNRRYEKNEIKCDTALKQCLEDQGVKVKSFNGTLICEPWTLTNKTGGVFKVFTPFWRAAQGQNRVPLPLPAPQKIKSVSTLKPSGAVSLETLNLLPTSPNWAAEMETLWEPGEAGAAKALRTFIDSGFRGYAENRNRPDLPSTSRLSPHLRMGEISVRQAWHMSDLAVQSGESTASAEDLRVFQSEIGWREFSYYLLYHQDDLANINVQRRFDGFPWVNDSTMLDAWHRGQTGYPIVDAGMRELWRTGFMHNRVRMVVASFLIKHLRIDWRLGEHWFWDTLLDADPASNPASWQWVAGSGADAAPFFRIFNPVTQGEKFDPDGKYVRHFVPELAKLPSKFIHAPWKANPLELASAGVKLGTTYPNPIVDHDRARQSALAAFEALTL